VWREDSGLPHHMVFAVKTHGDKVYAGTEGGAATLDRATGRWTAFPLESAPGAEDGLIYRVVTSVDVDDDGHLWFGTMKGLSWWDGARWHNFRMPEDQKPADPAPRGLVNNVVYGVTHQGGDVWVATTDGTSQFTKATGKWKTWYMNNSPMEETWCYGISASPNKVWLAAWGAGLMEYTVDQGHWQAYHDPDGSFAVDLLRNDGILSQMSTGSSFDQGFVWVSSYFGVTRYDGRDFRDWDEDHGLPSSFVNSVRARGTSGWVATAKGFAGFSNERWYAYRVVEEPGAQPQGTLTVTDGDGKQGQVYRLAAPPPHIFTWWIDFDQAGDIWVGTSNGVGHGTREIRTAEARQ